MRIFKLDNEYSVVCETEKTRSGFRHVAVLTRNGSSISKAIKSYYNRTWERYQFQSVLIKLIRGYFSNNEKLRDKFLAEIEGV